jgi:hypothetical protein
MPGFMLLDFVRTQVQRLLEREVEPHKCQDDLTLLRRNEFLAKERDRYAQEVACVGKELEAEREKGINLRLEIGVLEERVGKLKEAVAREKEAREEAARGHERARAALQTQVEELREKVRDTREASVKLSLFEKRHSEERKNDKFLRTREEERNKLIVEKLVALTK